MAISVDEHTGWSQTLQVAVASDPYSESSYSTNGASWYMRSWFRYNHWARIYKNNSNMTTILTKLSFRVCPGHSNGKQFAINSTGTSLAVTIGCGCTFFVRLYVVDSEGNKTDSGEFTGGVVPEINQYNCYAGSRGSTNTSTNLGTGFGKLNLYDVPGNDENGVPWRGLPGHPRYREHVQLTVPEANKVKVPVGGTLFVHVYAKDDSTYWTAGSTTANSLLVIQSDGDGNFTEETVVEDTDYIWVMTSEGWKKSKVAYQLASDGWIALKE